jgi:hypothetical protein
MTAADRRAKVDTAIENLSVRRQCELLAVDARASTGLDPRRRRKIWR